jgi:hypothetical protein
LNKKEKDLALRDMARLKRGESARYVASVEADNATDKPVFIARPVAKQFPVSSFLLSAAKVIAPRESRDSK